MPFQGFLFNNKSKDLIAEAIVKHVSVYDEIHFGSVRKGSLLSKVCESVPKLKCNNVNRLKLNRLMRDKNFCIIIKDKLSTIQMKKVGFLTSNNNKTSNEDSSDNCTKQIVEYCKHKTLKNLNSINECSLELENNVQLLSEEDIDMLDFDN